MKRLALIIVVTLMMASSVQGEYSIALSTPSIQIAIKDGPTLSHGDVVTIGEQILVSAEFNGTASASGGGQNKALIIGTLKTPFLLDQVVQAVDGPSADSVTATLTNAGIGPLQGSAQAATITAQLESWVYYEFPSSHIAYAKKLATVTFEPIAGTDPVELKVIFDPVPDPAQAISVLIGTVEDMNLQQGIDNSLDAKLDSALNALDDVNENNDVAAVNSLQALINAVEAQRENKITDEQADILVAAAQDIIDLLTSG